MVTRDYTDPTRKGCKFCGSKTVAWQTSDAGKWYLSEVFIDQDGCTYTERNTLHSAYCSRNLKPKSHDIEQSLRLDAEISQVKKNATLRKARDEKEAADEAEYFLGLHDLCKFHPIAATLEMQKRIREYTTLRDSGITMDYMVEYMRDVARLKRLRAEILFMGAALGAITDPEAFEKFISGK